MYICIHIIYIYYILELTLFTLALKRRLSRLTRFLLHKLKLFGFSGNLFTLVSILPYLSLPNGCN